MPRSRVLANLRFGFSRESEGRVDEVLELIGLADRQPRLAANLSHGQTQWLELGMLIVQNPKVLLLDEPTAGMTQAETHKTSEIINASRASTPCSSSSTIWRLCAKSPNGSPSCISGRFSPRVTSAEIETE